MSIGVSNKITVHMTHGWRWVALVAALVLIPAAPATSVADQLSDEGPMIDAGVRFVVGSVVSHDLSIADDFDTAIADVVFSTELRRVEGDWSISEQMYASPPMVVTDGRVESTDAVLNVAIPIRSSDYNGAYGGGSSYSLWEVTATRGETTAAVTVSDKLHVVQEDGTNWVGDPVQGTIATKGRWKTSHCNCWLGKAVLKTYQRWARMSFTATVTEGRVIAVVMSKAPNRGVARIKLDGAKQGHIDTYSETKVNRVIVWQTPPLEAGTHTIEVVNLATDGRRRIDVDAFLMVS